MDNMNQFNEVGNRDTVRTHNEDVEVPEFFPPDKRGKLDEGLATVGPAQSKMVSASSMKTSDASTRRRDGLEYCIEGRRPGPISIEDCESWTNFSTRLIHAKASGYDTLVGRLSAYHCTPPSSSCNACRDRLHLLDGVYFPYKVASGRWEWREYSSK